MPMHTLAAWLHTLDPFLVRFGPELGVRWYGLSYVVAFIIGWLLWRGLARRGLVTTPPERVPDAMIAVILGTMLGGRIGYIAVYDPALLTEFTGVFPFWGALAINKGGMASHGGLVGLCVAAWWVSRGWPATGPGGAIERVGRASVLQVMDILALIAPPGLFLGRCANFINGELLGAIVSPPGAPAPAWAVRFPQELRGWVEPGLRDALSHTPDLNAAQQATLARMVEQVRLPGESFSRGVERVVEQPGRFAEGLTQIVSARHPSQLYQAVAEGLVLGVVLWVIAARPRRAGVIAAWFFIVYGVLRVLTEVWRLPDPQFGATMRIAGLSRGQLLSVAMVAVGVALLVFALRRSRALSGGWRGSAARAAEG